MRSDKLGSQRARTCSVSRPCLLGKQDRKWRPRGTAAPALPQTQAQASRPALPTPPSQDTQKQAPTHAPNSSREAAAHSPRTLPGLWLQQEARSPEHMGGLRGQEAHLCHGAAPAEQADDGCLNLSLGGKESISNTVAQAGGSGRLGPRLCWALIGIREGQVMDHDPRNPVYIATQGPLPATVADFWQATVPVVHGVRRTMLTAGTPVWCITLSWSPRSASKGWALLLYAAKAQVTQMAAQMWG
ncbi:hypothetical protein P7K49_026058 [Saguinus oedipus]|uniref:Tyrosine-protein phosphatase domain-containing protein n=1 Tax=Saguinus oedipus TaxID=9490 RepID=A0ABQ9UIW9_SAGOE|nr:hypothetical protein P7K49_026058 [Saguinus oedipus]